MKSPAQISLSPRSSKNADCCHAGNHERRATLQARHIVRDAITALSAVSAADNEGHRTEQCCQKKLASIPEYPDSEGRRPGSGMRCDFPVVFSASRRQVR